MTATQRPFWKFAVAFLVAVGLFVVIAVKSGDSKDAAPTVTRTGYALGVTAYTVAVAEWTSASDASDLVRRAANGQPALVEIRCRATGALLATGTHRSNGVQRIQEIPGASCKM